MDIENYLPTTEVLNFYRIMGPYEKKLRNELMRPKRPGSDFALVSAAGRGGKGLWIIPAWHTLALTPEAAPGVHYAQGWFEGGSVRPVIDEGGVKAVNVVLEKSRNERFLRSATAVGIDGLPVSPDVWETGIRDLISVFDPDAFLHEGKHVRVYLRPAGYREGDFGVTAKGKPGVNISCIGWKWPLYLPEEVYSTGGIAAAFVDQQRLELIRGKVFGNYTYSGEVGRRARELGADEAVLFGPYVVADDRKKEYINHWEGERAYKRLAKEGILADGPGEDVLFFVMSKSGKIEKILVQPKDTGILAGTTRQYLINSLLPKMGIQVEEYPVTINDVRTHKVQGLAMCGNAANVAPIRELKLYDEKLELIEKFDLVMNDSIREFVKRFDDEVSGRIKPSGEELLTRIDLNRGARNLLIDTYKEWFE